MHVRHLLSLSVSLLVTGTLCAADPGQADFSKEIAPLLARYCNQCHGGTKPRAGLDLARFKSEAAIVADRKTWDKVVASLRSREMPPQDKPQPTPADRELLLGWLDVKLAAVDCTGNRDPGRVTIRRLNKNEYDNTIRDLVGVDFKPADDFPADDVGFGFDNIGEILSMPPVMMEKYLAAAESIIAQAWKDETLRSRFLIQTPRGKDDRAAAAKAILGAFARRAFRRPVTGLEIDRYARLVDLADKNGDPFEKGIQLALQAVLVSPHFLFRVEIDKEPNNPQAVHPISEHELASRLSYFLWSSMPDEELFTLAGKGSLRANLEPQVKRMLQDPKARALVVNFAGQWLNLRNLKTVTPDASRFPQWTEKLRADMVRETEFLFETVVKEDRPILDFLDADYTFVNERLAKLYGLAGVSGDQFQRVKLEDGRRGGVITQASVLTLTSNPTRTSPVKRGKWILENILGTPRPASAGCPRAG